MRQTGAVIALIGSVLSIVPALGAVSLVQEAQAQVDQFTGFMGLLAEEPPPDAVAEFFAAFGIDSVSDAARNMMICSGAAVLFSIVVAKAKARVASVLVLVPLGLGAWEAYPFLAGGEIRLTVLAYLYAVALAAAGALIVALSPAFSAAPMRGSESQEGD